MEIVTNDFVSLPTKCVTNIFSNLYTRDIFQFGRICPRFSMMAKNHFLASKLKVRSVKNPRGMFLRAEEIMTMIEFWSDNMRHFSLDVIEIKGKAGLLEICLNRQIFYTKLYAEFKGFFFGDLLRNLKNLATLNIRGNPLEVFSDGKALELFIRKNPKLNQVVMLHIRDDYIFAFFNTLAANIENLHIHGWKDGSVSFKFLSGRNLKVFHLVSKEVSCIIQKLFLGVRHMESVSSLMFFGVDSSRITVSTLRLISRLVHLKELRVGICGPLVTDQIVRNIVSRCTKITKLTIYADYTGTLTSDSIYSIFKFLPELETLGILGWNILELMPKHKTFKAPNLTHLRIHGCEKLLLHSLLKFMQQAPKLKQLHVLDCNFAPEDVQFALWLTQKVVPSCLKTENKK